MGKLVELLPGRAGATYEAGISHLTRLGSTASERSVTSESGRCETEIPFVRCGSDHVGTGLDVVPVDDVNLVWVEALNGIEQLLVVVNPQANSEIGFFPKRDIARVHMTRGDPPLAVASMQRAHHFIGSAKHDDHACQGSSLDPLREEQTQPRVFDCPRASQCSALIDDGRDARMELAAGWPLDGNGALPRQLLFAKSIIVKGDHADIFKVAVRVAGIISQKIISEVSASLMKCPSDPGGSAPVNSGNQQWLH